VRWREIADRSAAEALVGKVLVARLDDSETPADQDEFYDPHLVGLRVVDSTGNELGTVTRVDHLGFQDMLAVETSSGERLVPFVSALVPEVDLVNQRVVVTPIPGLLDDDAAVDSGDSEEQQ
jgi:16S rRNA processing protein RimM